MGQRTTRDETWRPEYFHHYVSVRIRRVFNHGRRFLNAPLSLHHLESANAHATFVKMSP